MKIKTWRSQILVFIGGAIGLSGCAAQGHGAFGGRNVAQAGSTTMVDAPSNPRNEGSTVAARSAPACFDVSDGDLRTSPLENRRVLAVTPVREPFPQKGRPAALLGANVYVLASPGLTKEWLGHLIECHVSRLAPNAAGPDPLAVGSATVDVVSTSNGFAVAITSKDPYQAERILRDSQVLLNGHVK